MWLGLRETRVEKKRMSFFFASPSFCHVFFFSFVSLFLFLLLRLFRPHSHRPRRASRVLPRIRKRSAERSLRQKARQLFFFWGGAGGARRFRSKNDNTKTSKKTPNNAPAAAARASTPGRRENAEEREEEGVDVSSPSLSFSIAASSTASLCLASSSLSAIAGAPPKDAERAIEPESAKGFEALRPLSADLKEGEEEEEEEETSSSPSSSARTDFLLPQSSSTTASGLTASTTLVAALAEALEMCAAATRRTSWGSE